LHAPRVQAFPLLSSTMTFYRAAKTAPTATLREDRCTSGHTPIANLFYGSGYPKVKTAYTASYSPAYTMPVKAEACRSVSPAPRKMQTLQHEWSACLGQLKEILHVHKDFLDQDEGRPGRRAAPEEPAAGRRTRRAGSAGPEVHSGRAQTNLASAVARARQEREARQSRAGSLERAAGSRAGSLEPGGCARCRANSRELPAAQVRSVSVDRNASLSGRPLSARRASSQGPPVASQNHRSPAHSCDRTGDLEATVQAPPTPREARAAARPPSAGPREPGAGAGSRPPSARLSSRPGSARPQSARSASARAPSQGRGGTDDVEGGYLTERRSSRAGTGVQRPPLPRPPGATAVPASTCPAPLRCATGLSRESIHNHNAGEQDQWCN